MIKGLFAKLMGWNQRPRESNWTKANANLGAQERNVIMNKAKETLKEEQARIEEQQKKKESKKEGTEEEMPIAA